MKSAAYIALAAVAVLGTACIGVANDTYYPYQTYDEYHRKITSPEPPPSEPPAPQPVPEKPKPPLRPEPPIKLTQAPEFLFPKELGYGVAVGVPYDLFYFEKEYYLLKSGNWYRAQSYKGPWMLQGFSKVPSDLRKQDLKMVRDVRNREFEKFWKDKAGYKGRYLRPDDTLQAPTTAPRKKEPAK